MIDAIFKSQAGHWLLVLIAVAIALNVANGLLKRKRGRKKKGSSRKIFAREWHPTPDAPPYRPKSTPLPKIEPAFEYKFEHDGPGKEISPPSLKVSPSQPDFTRWSLELLRTLEWHRFELVCAAYFEALGFRAKMTSFGADGGIDVLLYQANSEQPAVIVQCKAWKSGPVGVSLVRELYGVMARKKIAEGILLTTGTFTPDARAFPEGSELLLWDGTDFLTKIQALSDEKQQELLSKATKGDFTTPTCATCGIKMVRRTPKSGAQAFWGCTNFPRCRQTLNVPEAAA